MSEEQEAQAFTVEQRDEYARTKPGMLDPRRVGLLSWDELKVKPQQDQVVIKLDPPKMTASGIILTESSRRRLETTEATVIAVGPGAYDTKGRRIPMDVKPGDRVMVSGDPGWEAGPHRVLRQGAIMLVLSGDDG